MSESKSFLVPPKEIVYMTFGYENVLADSLWIRVIQDLDVCDPYGQHGVEEYLSTWKPQRDLDPRFKTAENANLDDLIMTEWKPPRCHKGWVYHMLDRITDLSPKYRRVYISGGLHLSIVVDDREGAELLYDKAVKNLPDNWQLAYHAGYHALYETRKFSKAADMFRLAAQHGAPPWIYMGSQRNSMTAWGGLN
ncbi:MAG: hypothetical protein R2827_12630 [Bdellovibrionales bacterium]